NAGYEGYYRYAMAPTDLAALGRAALKQDTAAKVGYLANLWALVQAGEVEATELLDTLIAHKRERDRVVIEQIIATLHQASDALVEKSSRAQFQAYVSALLLPTAKQLGFDARDSDSEDDRLLRRSVLSALAALTDEPWMLEESKKRARAYLEGKKIADPETAAIALRVMAHRGDAEVSFDKLAAALKTATTPARRVSLVQALGSLGNPTELRKALALVDSGTIRAQDAIHVMRSSIDWPESRLVFIAWLQENLPAIAERYPGFGVSRLMQPLRRVCEAEVRAEAARKFEPLVQEIGGLDRRLREALEGAALCVNLRARQARKVSAYLAKGKFG
ncbi:MAG TPA: ERAP1-like C-terminal domain-containing protein, partial [Polyangiaceae bacterium]|nr:ERAP1-like C-terminal domain-containing protein [Polyangiaceae bacterium]